MPNATPFPHDFLWGAATSAYQVEGSPLADGAGESIWHRYAHTPGRIANGDTGDVACDHYRRYAQDVELMVRLGLRAYRFSIAWGRVLPQGAGKLNSRGLDFYQRLVDALLAHGIEPMATLYHWDMPQALYERGGWLNPDSAGWFAEYARTMFDALDDRVRLWLTLNEPWVVTVAGYLHGDHAPGHRSLNETPRVAHALLRAHAAAATAYRAVGRHRIGLAVNLEPQHPASDAGPDLAAARRRDAFFNRWFLDPLFLGSYPAELADVFGASWPPFPVADLHGLRDTVDFLGVNYYSRSVVRDDPGERPVRAARVRQEDRPHTAMDWEVCPAGLAEILLWIKGRYSNPPVYITENGAAFDDPPPDHGELHDPQRVDFIRSHLRAARRALDLGVDLRGYFAWSLFDNFEWTYGYARRFGLVHVDFTTQQRTPKASARFYGEVIRSGGTNITGGT
jgi:beta-glucosidase